MCCYRNVRDISYHFFSFPSFTCPFLSLLSMPPHLSPEPAFECESFSQHLLPRRAQQTQLAGIRAQLVFLLVILHPPPLYHHILFSSHSIRVFLSLSYRTFTALFPFSLTLSLPPFLFPLSLSLNLLIHLSSLFHSACYSSTSVFSLCGVFSHPHPFLSYEFLLLLFT